MKRRRKMKKLIPLNEYPRPQFVRDSYICLNGIWEYAIRKEKTFPTQFDGEILVPYSPETKNSGVNKIVHPDEYLFYRLNLDIPKSFIKDKVILHFGAVDQIAEVFVNNTFVIRHKGGFLPFSVDIKPYLKASDNVLTLRVQDFTNKSYHSVGKQSLKPGGIFYTPQSGIWQTVWLESVANGYIEKIKLTPDIDKKEIHLAFKSEIKRAKVKLFDQEYDVEAGADNIIRIENMHLWSPENPYLYNFTIYNDVDTVSSYFAMRKISLVKDANGHKLIALNNKPYFNKGVLDQGYYADGLLTPNTDQDLINDVKLTKELGFNVSRKHIKIEPLRWYYHCDRLGLLVWQDFVNGCTKFNLCTNILPALFPYHPTRVKDNKYRKFNRKSLEGRSEAKQEFRDTIDHLYNCPSIVVWTIFNEAWGQFDAKEIYESLKKIDPTRLFDHASGWQDQGSGDFKSMHIYRKKIKVPQKLDNRAFIVSECGAFIFDKSSKNKAAKKGFFYISYDNQEDFQNRYKRFIEEDIIPNVPKGLAAFIYTQFSDVEEEMNGFVTFNRQEIKVDVEYIKAINDKICM
jgi:hypothetical protein